MDYRQQLLVVAAAYCRGTDRSLARVATMARNDGKFFSRLQAGASCTIRIFDATLQWFSNEWPSKIAWPRGVNRPRPNNLEQINTKSRAIAISKRAGRAA